MSMKDGRMRRLLTALSKQKFWRVDSMPDFGCVIGLPLRMTIDELRQLGQLLHVFCRKGGAFHSDQFTSIVQFVPGIPQADGYYVYVTGGVPHQIATLEEKTRTIARARRIRPATPAELENAIVTVLRRFPYPHEADMFSAPQVPPCGGLPLWAIPGYVVEELRIRERRAQRAEIQSALCKLIDLGRVERISAAQAGEWKSLDGQRTMGDVVRIPPKGMVAQTENTAGAGKSGRKPVSPKEAEQRREILSEWEQAKAAGTQRKEFCADKGISVRDLKRFADWALKQPTEPRITTGQIERIIRTKC